MKPRTLFVCLGNICRSPSAEAVFRTRSDAPCDSAGTGGWHVGDPPYGPMLKTLERRGFPARGLRARQFHADDYDAFDLIIAMDPQNLRDIERLRPSDQSTPVRLLTSYLDDAPEAVPDPYYTRDFDGALDLIDRAITALIAAERL